MQILTFIDAVLTDYSPHASCASSTQSLLQFRSFTELGRVRHSKELFIPCFLSINSIREAPRPRSARQKVIIAKPRNVNSKRDVRSREGCGLFKDYLAVYRIPSEPFHPVYERNFPTRHAIQIRAETHRWSARYLSE